MKSLFFLCVVLCSGSALAEDCVVIRNASAKAAQVTKAELRGAFTGKVRAWGGGTVVVVLQPETSPAFQWLAENIFAGSAKMLASKIRQEVFKGDMNKPTQVTSDAEVIEQVKQATGAVGVVCDEAAKSLPAQVVVVKVE